MSSIQNKIIRILIIINLILLTFILLGKISILHSLWIKVIKTFLIPLVFSTFLYYIIRPLNNRFINRGITYGKASALTLIICSFISSGIFTLFSKYAYVQFEQLSKQLLRIVSEKQQENWIIDWTNKYINTKDLYTVAANMVKNYVYQIGQSFLSLVGYFMSTFSMVFLVIVLIFYMLKDGHDFKKKVLELIPEKYKNLSYRILSESDTILSQYVTGQAKVALSLSIMIFAGYKLIGMPNALLLSSITFILAFIPFVGFFISMIIPVIIALGIGLSMLIKLIILFIAVQTLKGRVVVPAIMAKAMNIHPITDIFLVIGAVTIGGPFAAFAVVPVYAIIKRTISILRSG